MQVANQLNGKSHPNEAITNSKIEKAMKILESIDSEDIETIQDKVVARFEHFKESFSDSAHDLSRNVKARARLVNKSAHNEPWKYVGAATLLGVAAGLFLGSRRK